MNIILWLVVLQSFLTVTHQYLYIPNIVQKKVPKRVATNIREIVQDLSPELKKEIIETTNNNSVKHYNSNTNQLELNTAPFNFIISKDNKKYRVKLIKKPGWKERSHGRDSAITDNISRTRHKTTISHLGFGESSAYAAQPNITEGIFALQNVGAIKEKVADSEFEKHAYDVERFVIKTTANPEKIVDKNTKFSESVKDDENKDNSKATQISPDSTMTNTDKMNKHDDVTSGEHLSSNEFDSSRINIAEDTDKAVLNVKVIDNVVTLKLLECLIHIYPELRSRLKTSISNIVKGNRGNGEINIIIKGTLQPNVLSKLFGVTSFYDEGKTPIASLPANYVLLYKIPDIMVKIKRKHPEINENVLYQYLISIYSKLYPDLKHIANNNILRTQPLTSITQTTQQMKYKNRFIPLIEIQPNHETETDQEWYKKIKLHLPKNNIPEKYVVINQKPKLELQFPLSFKLKPKEPSQKQYTGEINELSKVKRLRPRQQRKNRFKPRYSANQYLEKIPNSKIIYLRPGYVTSDQYLAVKPKYDYFDNTLISKDSEKLAKPKNTLNHDPLNYYNNLFHSNIPHVILRQEKYKPVTKYSFPFYSTPNPMQENEKKPVQTYSENINQNNLMPVQVSTEKNYIRHTDHDEVDVNNVNKTDPPKLYMSNHEFNIKELLSNKGITSDSVNTFVSPEIKMGRQENYEMPSYEDSKYSRDELKIIGENKDTEFIINNKSNKASEESNEYPEMKKPKISNEPQINEYDNLELNKNTDKPETDESFRDLASGVPDIIKVNESISPDSNQHIIPRIEDDDNISPETPLDEQNKKILQTNKSFKGFESINSDVASPDTENNDKLKPLGAAETEKPRSIQEIHANDNDLERNTPNTDGIFAHIEIKNPYIIQEIITDDNNPVTIVKSVDDNTPRINDSFITSETQKPFEIQEVQKDTKSPETMSPETDESNANNPLTISENRDDNAPKIDNSIVISKSEKPYEIQEIEIDTKSPEIVFKNPDDNSPETDESNANNPLTRFKSLDDNTPKIDNSFITFESEKPYEAESDTKRPEIIFENPADNSEKTNESSFGSEKPYMVQPIEEHIDSTQNNTGESLVKSENKEPSVIGIQTDIRSPEIILENPDNDLDTFVKFISPKIKNVPIIQQLQEHVKNPQTDTPDTDKRLDTESENKELTVIGIKTDTSSPEKISESPDSNYSETLENVTSTESSKPYINKKMQEDSVKDIQNLENGMPNVIKSEDNSVHPVTHGSPMDFISNMLKEIRDKVPETYEKLPLRTKEPYINEEIQADSQSPHNNVSRTDESLVYSENKKPDVVVETQTDTKSPDYNSAETVKNVVTFESVEPYLNKQIQADSSNFQNLADEISELIKNIDNPIEPTAHEIVEHPFPKNIELTVEKIDDHNPETADSKETQTEKPAKNVNDKTSTESLFYIERDANDGVEYNLPTELKIPDRKTENSGQDNVGEGDSNIETVTLKTQNEPKTSKPVIVEDKNYHYLPPTEEFHKGKFVEKPPRKLNFDSSEIESILGLPSASFKNYFLALTADMLNSALEKFKKYLKDNSVKSDVISKIDYEVRADMKKIFFIEGYCPDAQLKHFVKKLADSIKEKAEKIFTNL